MLIGRIEVCCSLVGVQGVCGLVVTRLVLERSAFCGTHQRGARSYQSAQVVPDLGNVWIEANGARVRVECIAVLVDLVIENSDRAPEGWVSPITIDSLLVRFVCFGILLLRHVAST